MHVMITLLTLTSSLYVFPSRQLPGERQPIAAGQGPGGRGGHGQPAQPRQHPLAGQRGPAAAPGLARPSHAPPGALWPRTGVQQQPGQPGAGAASHR